MLVPHAYLKATDLGHVLVVGHVVLGGGGDGGGAVQRVDTAETGHCSAQTTCLVVTWCAGQVPRTGGATAGQQARDRLVQVRQEDLERRVQDR